MKWALRMIMMAPKIVEGIMMISTVARMPTMLSRSAAKHGSSGGPDEEDVDTAHRADQCRAGGRERPR